MDNTYSDWVHNTSVCAYVYVYKIGTEVDILLYNIKMTLPVSPRFQKLYFFLENSFYHMAKMLSVVFLEPTGLLPSFFEKNVCQMVKSE